MNYTIVHPINGDAETYGYSVQGGGQVRREWGQTPNGNQMAVRWVYRDGAGNLIDFNRYRHDLFEHHNLREAP
jgi:hypothetical protein